MGENKGAPSFYKTVQAYTTDWNVHLIIMMNNNQLDGKFDGVTMHPFSSMFSRFGYLKVIGLFARYIHTYVSYKKMMRIGNNCIKMMKGPTVIYAYEIHGVKAAKQLSRKYGLPLVTRFQGTVLHPVKRTIINRMRRYPHFSALRVPADITIMTNDGTKGNEVLKRVGNASSKTYFWRNGIDQDSSHIHSEKLSHEIREQYGVSIDDFLLITVSRLARWKHVERSIYAVKEIVERGITDIKLLIVGDGAERDNLQHLVSENSLDEYIKFAGAVARKEVNKFMDSADLFLSLYDLSNVGNPLLESMMLGKPIITYDVGDTGEIISDRVNGFLIPKGGMNELPERILELKNDPELRQLLGQNAKNFAENEFWSWRERLKAELDAVEKLLS
jgi:glycosyltransferase involved in cell wall biosynthesis